MRRRRYPVLRGNILGLDLSLRSPAAVVIRPGWRLGVWEDLVVDHHWPDEPEPGFRAATRRRRLIVERLVAFAHQHHVAHAFVESYAFSRSSSSVTKLAELGGVARDLFLDILGLELVEVTASAARKLLLGSVPRKGSKLAVQVALKAAGAKFKNDDVCDAFAIANYGLSELGQPAVMLHGWEAYARKLQARR